MDGATIQARVYGGFARAALRIGLLHDQFRPLTASAPLGNRVQGLLAAFDSTADYKFKKGNEFGDALWAALLDHAAVQNGDYLVGAGKTWFVAGKPFLMPVQAVECNRSVALLRAASSGASVGVQSYGGVCSSDSEPALGAVNPDGSLAAGWPCSILLGGRQERGTELPMAVNNAGFQILLPVSVPVAIRASDIFLDDLGRRYIAEGPELSSLGWRVTAREVHA